MADTNMELFEKIQQGEDSTIDFKATLAKTKSSRNEFANEIAAFCNSNGGVIVVGVADNREIVGISTDQLQEYEKLVIEICRNIEPRAIVYTEKLKLNDSLVLKVDIPRGLFVHKSPGGYFTREGSSKRELSPDQLARLFQGHSRTLVSSFDELAVPCTQRGILHESLYNRFINPHEDEESLDSLLQKRRILVKEKDNLQASAAGVLMCCHNPSDYIPNSFILAVRYRGKHRNANHQVDAKDFKGPLDKQIVDAFNFVLQHRLVSTRKRVGREDFRQYDDRAIFESIVNAVVHRDYSMHSSKIRLFMFEDRLELYSPGRLAKTLTVDNMRFNQATRNEHLVRLLSELELDFQVGRKVARGKFLEGRGEGVSIILRESEKLSGYKPVYTLRDDELCLTIYPAPPPQEL